MKAAMTRMASALGAAGFLASAGAFAALAASISVFGGGAPGAERRRVRPPAAGDRLAPRFERRAGRRRTSARRARRAPSALARSLGCENRKFLIFGSNPPPQCGRAQRTDRAHAGQSRRPARRARAAALAISSPAITPNASMRRQDRPTSSRPCSAASRSLRPRRTAADGRQIRAAGAGSANQQARPTEKRDASRPTPAPTRFACAPATAASFRFPIRAPEAAADSLEEVCRALCPNADMALYSFPFGGTIEEAVSPSGEPYANLPNAGKFEQSDDPTCSCRRKGETWAEALADAEARYGHEKHDIIVTPEKSAEMARPIIDPKAKPAVDPKAKPGARSRRPGAGPPRPAQRPRSTPRTRRSSTSTAPTPNSAPRPPPSAVRRPASPATTSRARRASA